MTFKQQQKNPKIITNTHKTLTNHFTKLNKYIYSVFVHFSFLLSLRLPYKMYFGGVSALTPDQYLKMNGFPNNYWGWGGEDDDIGVR